ncbi:Rieske 2Fe-2S domain-containing protein [Mycobacterium deserti]|uniref:Rieske 2Fe-2S domain-containing protein n=1 Tax=Mycobacterium deserti TaxID=2978347 RepID=A0ABT2MHV7_9MYCO|nr:Rieske 2Fe-2S domain-containing protein [Mycobacterium deserti]MCT7661863.1 Rieske 2Fe-2S domain-containing protein [Mycobacterium deserti]
MALLFTKEDNDKLTQTGPGTPMGDVMRSYWFPAFLSERLPAPHCDPIEITLLGEPLVAFRGADGRIGLLDRFCPHRRASLALARNEDCAVRCVYHGWKVDADGNVLETPPEPPNSRFAQSIKHTAYPTREAGGMVWTYMGPPESTPPFPEWPFNTVPAENIWANHFYQPSNWLQGLEGDVDAGHAGYLHYSRDEWERQRATESRMGKFLFDPKPLTDVAVEPWGLQTIFRYALEDERDAVFWVHPFVMPFYTLFAASFEGFDGGVMHAWVPSTDESHYVYSVVWSNDGPLSDEAIAGLDAGQQFSAVNKANNYMSTKWNGDGYTQDRRAMDRGELYSGFNGIHLQDLAVQYSMGPIVDRSKEHLGAEDFLVIQVRRYLLDVLASATDGQVLPGLQPDMDYSAIEHRWVVAPADTALSLVLQNKDMNSLGEPIPDDWAPAEHAWSSLPL